jgi:nucleotide-binding universal stress UspA family protein
MKLLIAYDGTLHAKKALSYGLEKVKAEGGRVLVIQVFDPRLFIDYDAGPAAEELARAEASRMHQEAQKILQDQGSEIEHRIVFAEGDAATVIARYAEEEHADLILAPAALKGLAKSLSRPVQVIPGTVLVPVDNTDCAFENLESIVREARATGSRVHLAGIVPIHLYSRDEKQELEQIKARTRAALHRLSAALKGQNIATDEEVRFGYPDEEILSSAEAQGPCLILLPSGGTTPSELSKAAAIILAEADRVKWPLLLLPQHGAA